MRIGSVTMWGYSNTVCARINDSMKCWGSSLENLMGLSVPVKNHFTINGSGY